MRQTTFLRRLSEAHDRLRRAVAGLEASTAGDELVVGDWTVKDVLGHVVSWNDEFRFAIREILRGRHPGYERPRIAENDFDEPNQRWFSEKRSWTWSRILTDLDRAYRESLELILALRPEDYRRRGVTPWKPAARSRPEEPTQADTDLVGTHVTYHWRHMNEHARTMEKWRVRRAKGRRHG